jgi:hypothetical protein
VRDRAKRAFLIRGLPADPGGEREREACDDRVDDSARDEAGAR